MLVAIICCFVFSYLLYDDSLIDFDDRSASTPLVGVISDKTNDVRQKFSRQYLWRPSKLKAAIHQGDSLFTGTNSQSKVILSDGSEILIKENSLIVFSNSKGDVGLDFKFGQVVANFSATSKMKLQECGEDFEISGKNGQLQFDKEAGCKGLRVKVVSGEVAINGKKFVTPAVALLNKGSKPVAVTASPVEKIAATKIIPSPLITEPIDHFNHILNYDENDKLLSANTLAIKWTFPKKALFDVELSQDALFKQIVDKSIESGYQKTSPQLAMGNYYLRVREHQDPKSKVITSKPWSKTVHFSVSKNFRPPTIEPPVLLTKNIIYQAPADNPPVFKWQAAKGAAKYVFEIAKQPDFKDKTEISLDQLRFEWSKYSRGKYHFRVLGLSPKGYRGPVSETGFVDIRLARPLLEPVAPLTVQGKTPEDQGDPQEFKVKWTGLPIAESYKVEISEDDSFKKPITYVSRGPASTVIVPKPGNFKWRVQPLASNGKPLTPYSNRGELQYNLKVPLATPSLLEPASNMTLFFQKTAAQIFWLEWKNVRQAESYQLEVATDKEFAKVVFKTETKKPRFLMKQKLPQGKLFWRVRADGDGKSSHWSEARRMKVFAGKSAQIHSFDEE